MTSQLMTSGRARVKSVAVASEERKSIIANKEKLNASAPLATRSGSRSGGLGVHADRKYRALTDERCRIPD